MTNRRGGWLRAAALGACVLMGAVFSSQPCVAENRVWTADEILAERKEPRIKKHQRFCSGGVFKPCVCPRDVPTITQYRPAVKECGGRAAIVLSGKYTTIYSVVVRDVLNRDRWPISNFGGCSVYERDELGLNKCSAFKVQKIISLRSNGTDAEIHCLGASGYSSLFRGVRRITAKFSDDPNSSNDPLARWCLAGPDQPLN